MRNERKIGKVFLLLACAIIFALAIVGQAKADVTYTFGADGMFGAPMWGGVAPTGTWATATFIDVSTDNVQLTLNVTNNITSVESIGEFFFNYLGDATSLTITEQAGGGSSAAGQTGNNSFQADGDGLYDLLFDFPPPPGGSAKFTAGETVTYDISGTGVSAANFYTLAAPGQSDVGPFYAAARLQGIPCTTDPNDPDYDTCHNSENQGSTSAWSAPVVPEPVSSTLFIVGSITLGFTRFKRRFEK
jgi:hypothetical protein